MRDLMGPDADVVDARQRSCAAPHQLSHLAVITPDLPELLDRHVEVLQSAGSGSVLRRNGSLLARKPAFPSLQSYLRGGQFWCTQAIWLHLAVQVPAPVLCATTGMSEDRTRQTGKLLHAQASRYCVQLVRRKAVEGSRRQQKGQEKAVKGQAKAVKGQAKAVKGGTS